MSIKVLVMYDETHVLCAICHTIIFDFDNLLDKQPSWTHLDILKDVTAGINTHFTEKHSLYDE